MKTYRIDCYNLEETEVVYSVINEFCSDQAAVLYAFKLTSDYFNILISRATGSYRFVKVAKLF